MIQRKVTIGALERQQQTKRPKRKIFAGDGHSPLFSVLPPDLFFSIFATASVLVAIGGRDRYDEGVITRGDLDKAIEGHHPHRMCEEDQE